MIESTQSILPLSESYKAKYFKLQFSNIKLKPVPFSFENRLKHAMYNRALRKAYRRMQRTMTPPVRRGRNKQKALAKLSVMRHEISKVDFTPYVVKYAAQRIHDTSHKHYF